MPHTTILFVHLQYDAPHSPQSRALRALAAPLVGTTAPPPYLVGVYAHDDFDTDSLPLAVARAVRTAHQARTDTAMAGRLQAHIAALAAERIAVTPLLRAGEPRTVLAQVARELDAALVLIGTPQQAQQDFAVALGGTYEALQAALPCQVCRALPPAVAPVRGRHQGYTLLDAPQQAGQHGRVSRRPPRQSRLRAPGMDLLLALGGIWCVGGQGGHAPSAVARLWAATHHLKSLQAVAIGTLSWCAALLVVTTTLLGLLMLLTAGIQVYRHVQRSWA